MKGKQKGTVVYVYAILDQDDKPVYIGKSSSPKSRCYAHAVHFKKSVRMQILDYFYDLESYWIKKSLDEGCQLVNKSTDVYEERWKVGDIIEVCKQKKIAIINTLTGERFESIAEASRVTGINYQTIQNVIKHPSKEVYKQYNLVVEPI